jgi:hypothetical protein
MASHLALAARYHPPPKSTPEAFIYEKTAKKKTAKAQKERKEDPTFLPLSCPFFAFCALAVNNSSKPGNEEIRANLIF